MRRILLLAAALASCDGAPPPEPEDAEIVLGGARLKPIVFFAGLERSRAPDRLGSLPPDRAGLVGYAHARNIHLYDPSMSTDFDVAFLDASRRVAEVADLPDDHERGVTSSVPAKYALILRSGWLAEHGVKKGDAVEFPDAVAAREPEALPTLEIGSHKVRVELARDDAERQRGLMHRRHLSPDDGMLFRYPGGERPHTYWMRNTWIPLDIAFLRADGTVTNVAETPVWDDPEFGDGPRASSDGDCKYVLELNLGWFRRHDLLDADGKVKPGTRVLIPKEHQDPF